MGTMGTDRRLEAGHWVGELHSGGPGLLAVDCPWVEGHWVVEEAPAEASHLVSERMES